MSYILINACFDQHVALIADAGQNSTALHDTLYCALFRSGKPEIHMSHPLRKPLVKKTAQFVDSLAGHGRHCSHRLKPPGKLPDNAGIFHSIDLVEHKNRLSVV